MSAVRARRAEPRSFASPRPEILLGTFGATLFLSALLLFAVEPMFAKLALPVLGGTPAVWAVSLCFFQAALLAGYLYAHALNRFFEPRRAVLFHVLLLALAALTLPVGLPAMAGDPPQSNLYAWLICVLALGVGLPFLAISASAPLLQAWFSTTSHRHANDPYFLYGASNVGSLLALLSYPVAIEPRFGLLAQSEGWSALYVVLALLVALCGALAIVSRGLRANAPQQSACEISGRPITLRARAAWIALAAIPSALMVAVTTYITTDVASAPFIWVVPLAIYLATFIVVFRDRLPFRYGWALAGLPAAILVHLLLPAHATGVASGVIAFALAAIVCHRELYLRRPEAPFLTEFYLYMSLGGAIGGVFSALIAPEIFASVIEFKLLLILSLLGRPGVMADVTTGRQALRLALFTAAMAALFAAFKALDKAGVVSGDGVSLAFLIAIALSAVAMTRNWPEHRCILILTMLAGLAIIPTEGRTIYAERSFFGTIRVMESKNRQFHLMLHGTTVHGAERFLTSDGKPVLEPKLATYYHPQSGPLTIGVSIARQLAEARGEDFAAGIVGLGTGSLACTAKPGDSWTFYEIDPMVARVARNKTLFRFLSKCLPDNRVVFGDARLTLQKEANGRLNYLAIDAFSSDAIPVHLLTREAISMYLDKLAPGGVLALHISNRFLDLAPSVGATLATIPGVRSLIVFPPAAAPEPEATPSRVIFVVRDADTEAALKARWPSARAPDPDGSAAWTDDYSNVLSALIRGSLR